MLSIDYIKKYVNVKLQPSNINGVGVFALKDINDGEEIFVPWKEKTDIYYITTDDLETLDINVKQHILDMYEYQKINEKWMIPIYLNYGCHWIFKTPLHWVNSCANNETPNIDREKLITNRKIFAGEELLTKYGKFDRFKSNRKI